MRFLTNGLITISDLIPLYLPVFWTRPLGPILPLGLVSLKNPRSEVRPNIRDTIVFTVHPIHDPENVLAGARLPVSRIAQFPVRFRLDERNLMPSEDATKSPLATGDLLVRAVVCSPPDEDKRGIDHATQYELGTTITKRNRRSNNDDSSSNRWSMEQEGCTHVLRLGASAVAKLLQFDDQKTTVRAPVSLILAPEE